MLQPGIPHLKLWKEVSHADIRTFDEDVQKAFIDALNQVRGLKELSETTKISDPATQISAKNTLNFSKNEPSTQNKVDGFLSLNHQTGSNPSSSGAGSVQSTTSLFLASKLVFSRFFGRMKI